MKLWLARHARPLVADGVCYGASDVPADVQATLDAGADLAARLPPGLVVSSSPLSRCLQLADALQALRPELHCRRDARLAEMNFGAWEVRLWNDIAKEEFDAWTADFAHHRCGGGESVTQVMARTQAALADVRREAVDALWITHAGVIRAVGLLAGGVAVPLRAADWPRECPGFGQSICIDLGGDSGKTP